MASDLSDDLCDCRLLHGSQDVDPDETEEEAAARKKMKADRAAAIEAKKRGNALYSEKVCLSDTTDSEKLFC